MIVIEKASVLLHRNTADQGTYLEVILLLVLESRVAIHVGNVKNRKADICISLKNDVSLH